ncbi:MAG: hypothetical protein ACKVP7_27530 [Hyphomicrobiaceae bacterium]
MQFTNETPASTALIGLVLAASVVATLFHPTPMVLAMLGAGMIVAGLLGAGWVALSNRRKGLAVMERMTIPALLVFAGCAATILCDLDAAVSVLR